MDICPIPFVFDLIQMMWISMQSSVKLAAHMKTDNGACKLELGNILIVTQTISVVDGGAVCTGQANQPQLLSGLGG